MTRAVATPASQRKRLDSWKAIAEYLGRNVRTVTRWAEQRDLPVHRVPGGKRQSVFAYSDEIDEWLNSQGRKNYRLNTRPEGSHKTEPISSARDVDATDHIPGVRRPLRTTLVQPVGISGMFVGLVVCLAVTLWLVNLSIAGRRRAAASVPLAFVQLTNDGRDKGALRSDGTDLYFYEMAGGQRSVFSLALKGGTTHRIDARLPEPLIQDVSRHGQGLLVTSVEGTESEGLLWIVPSSGGAARRVGDLSCRVARWSPDGRRVACVQGTTIKVANADGTNVQTLASLASTASALVWAPDGGRLRFLMGEFLASPAVSAWEIETKSGAGKQPVALSLGDDCCVNWSWSENGEHFVYMRRGADDRPILESISGTAGSSHTVVPDNELPVQTGTVLDFATDERNHRLYLLIKGAERGELLRVDPRANTFQAFLPGLSAHYVAFTRDGRWMTYVNTVDKSLWRSRADGSDAIQLTSPPVQVEISSWSSDGLRIAYTGRAPGEPWRIFLVGRDGTGRKELSRGDDNQGGPSWSPDGKTIAYGDVLCEQTQTCWIHLLDTETGRVSQLPDSHGLRTARFSPDGRHIAALRPETHQLLIFDTATKRWKILAGSITGDNINWSKDSRYVFTDSPRGDRPVIEKIRIVDGHREKVAELGSLSKMIGEESPWFGLAPDGSPILLHFYNSSEIYALRWDFH